MKKVFIVTGEVSGDKLAAWYIDKRSQHAEKTEYTAIGGAALAEKGITLFERMENLNVVGILEIIKNARRLLSSLARLTDHIITNDYDEVVLVDFPGFNLRLAKALKKKKPSVKIIYLSPPQLWAWGQWRLKSLKKYCDKVIVLYPFERAWYAQRGCAVEWIGSPHYDRLKKYINLTIEKKPMLALLPGSRRAELREMLPFMMQVVRRFKMVYSDARVIIPLARSFSAPEMKKMLRNAGAGRWGLDIEIVEGEDAKYRTLRSASVALAKPGTGTLELALLKVPTVVMYKTSWFTYILARPFVRIEKMALPNLLARIDLFDECIQTDCTFNKVFGAVSALYKAYQLNDPLYAKKLEQLEQLSDSLK